MVLLQMKLPASLYVLKALLLAAVIMDLAVIVWVYVWKLFHLNAVTDI